MLDVCISCGELDQCTVYEEGAICPICASELGIEDWDDEDEIQEAERWG